MLHGIQIYTWHIYMCVTLVAHTHMTCHAYSCMRVCVCVCAYCIMFACTSTYYAYANIKLQKHTYFLEGGISTLHGLASLPIRSCYVPFELMQHAVTILGRRLLLEGGV